MRNFMINAYFKVQRGIYNFSHKENGEANIVAIILVLAIVILLAVVFRKYIAQIFNNVWEKISSTLGGSTSTDHDFSHDVGGVEVSAIRNLFI